MRIMIALLALIITGGFFATSLTACGDKDDDTSVEAEEVEDQEAEEGEAEDEEEAEEEPAEGGE